MCMFTGEPHRPDPAFGKGDWRRVPATKSGEGGGGRGRMPPAPLILLFLIDVNLTPRATRNAWHATVCVCARSFRAHI